MKKKLFTLLLVLAMMLSLFGSAFAAHASAAGSATRAQAGQSVDMSLNKNGESSGVTVANTGEGVEYFVAISEDQTRSVGELAIVNVTINSTDYETFNTIDMSFTYDAAKLELNTTEIDGYILSPGNGRLRVMRYGSDCPVGSAFTLSFNCLSSGTALVELASARVDNSTGAVNNDMLPATIIADTVTINIHTTGGGEVPAPTTYEINISETENGSVTAKPQKAALGENITLTLTPDKGYKLEKVTVTDKDGNEIPLTKNADGTYSFEMPNGPVTVTASFSPLQNAADRFVDVSKDDWFYDAVNWAAENDLMRGISSSMFGPYMPMNRGMVATVLYRMEGEPAAKTQNPFSDIEDGKWYTDAINWGAENGILLGYPDGAFRPLQEITREQLAAIMMRYAAYKGHDVTMQSDLSSFVDGDLVSGWAKENVSWAVAVGLIKGRDGNRIAPLEYTTRAEAAMILKRFCEKYAA